MSLPSERNSSSKGFALQRLRLPCKHQMMAHAGTAPTDVFCKVSELPRCPSNPRKKLEGEALISFLQELHDTQRINTSILASFKNLERQAGIQGQRVARDIEGGNKNGRSIERQINQNEA